MLKELFFKVTSTMDWENIENLPWIWKIEQEPQGLDINKVSKFGYVSENNIQLEVFDCIIYPGLLSWMTEYLLYCFSIKIYSSDKKWNHKMINLCIEIEDLYFNVYIYSHIINKISLFKVVVR